MRMGKPQVIPVERVSLTYASWAWPFAAQRRAGIEAYFAEQREKNPALWNGPVLLLRNCRIEDREFAGSLFETDYASMLAGHEWGAIGDDIKAGFGVAALVSSDRAFVAGVMAPHTRNAGQIYFPSGSIDPGDVVESKVDLYGSVQRELTEETGLAPVDVEPERGWYAVLAGADLPVLKILRAREPAEDLKARILTNLASQAQPEFTDVRLLRSPSDIDPRMPQWMTAFLAHVWG